MAFNEYQLTTSVSYKPFTCIPRFLLDLTKLKTSDEKRLREQTYQLLQRHHDMRNVVRLMHSQENNINFHEICLRYNFDHLLEMIISSVIEKKLNGNYLKKPDLEHAIEIEKYCQELRPKSYSSGPRLILLFLYLKFSSIDDGYKKESLDIGKDFVNCIGIYKNFININIYESDWMLLLLKLLHEGIGEKLLVQHLQHERSLIDILSSLNHKTKRVIIGSLINYANSIEEEHLLFQDFI